MPRKHFKEAANKLSSMLFLLRDSDDILDELITHMRDSEKIETLSETFALMFFDNLSSNNKNANLIRKLYRILSVRASPFLASLNPCSESSSAPTSTRPRSTCSSSARFSSS